MKNKCTMKSWCLSLIIAAIFCFPLVAPAQIKGSDTSPAGMLPARPGGSKEKSEKTVRFEWVEPYEGQPTKIENGKAQVRVVIRSDEPLQKENIGFQVNGQSGSKANEIRLYGSDGDHSLTYVALVPMADLTGDLNELRVVVNFPSGRRISSDPLMLARTGEQVSTVAASPVGVGLAGGFEIFWVQPDPIMLGDKPLVHKEQEMEVRFQIRAPQILLRDHLSMAVNNILYPISPNALLRGKDGRYTLVETVTLNEKVMENLIQLHLQVPGGVKMLSEPLRVNFASDRPNLYVLSIGTKTNLTYTVKDATDFADLYQKQGGLSGNRLFRSVQTDLLTGAAATAAEIQGTIEELLVKMETGVIQPSDLVMLFISSHGFIDDRSQEFRIQGDDYDANRSRATSVSYERDILNVLQELPCKKLIFIDACHSGSGAKASPQDIQKEIDKLNDKKEGLTVIVSSQQEEESYEDVSWRNGAFTEVILEALGQGKADKNENNIITIKELFDYLSGKVPEIVGAVKARPQHPRLLSNELGNVSIYVTEHP